MALEMVPHPILAGFSSGLSSEINPAPFPLPRVGEEIFPDMFYFNEFRSLKRYNKAGRIERMQSLNKRTTSHPDKKKALPAVRKESPKSGVSLTGKKKPKEKKVVGKVGPQPRKKEALKAAAKPAQKPATPAAAKKPPVKAKPAAQAKKPVKKKEAPKVKGETFGAKVVSIEMDRTAEAKHAIRGEKIQARKVTVIPVDLGKRYKCYKCGIKFYDLGKPQPLCPSCGANQHDAVIKAARKRRGKHRSSYAAKTEPITVAPEETEDLHEVVGELDAEYVLDVDDIVLEEHHDAEDKE
jgi:hypothetical protein